VFIPWIPEPSVNNKLKHREGSGIIVFIDCFENTSDETDIFIIYSIVSKILDEIVFIINS
jgi:hypothetical protein